MLQDRLEDIDSRHNACSHPRYQASRRWIFLEMLTRRSRDHIWQCSSKHFSALVEPLYIFIRGHVTDLKLFESDEDSACRSRGL